MVRKDSKILLGMKKRGFGVGRWNGFGGKVTRKETIEESAIREVKEEIEIEVLDMEKVGRLNFEFQNKAEILEVHVFAINKFSGEPKETEEMRPRWFEIRDIPFDKMWPDDIFWMPLFLEGKKFKGKFIFDKPSNAEYLSKIISSKLSEVEKI